MKDNMVNVILGPTSTGKTSLAVDLCRRHDGEIISADSRQIYKGFDIGTGKLPVNLNVSIIRKDKYWIVDGINVWGYDLADPMEYFSAYDYALFALDRIGKLMRKGRTVFLVGGTGFYLDLITGKMKTAGVEPDLELRNELKELSLKQLRAKLASLNPDRLKSVDLSNPFRLIRAIEVGLNKKRYDTPLPYLKNVKFNFIGLTASRDFLYKNVDSWLDSVWENGLIDETRNALLVYKDLRILSGLVYKSAVKFLNGETKEESAKQEAKYALHAYVRRQQTWFKKNGDVKWFDISRKGYAQKVENQLQLS